MNFCNSKLAHCKWTMCQEAVWGRETVDLSTSPGPHSARLARLYFSHLTPFFAFFYSLNAEPSPKLA